MPTENRLRATRNRSPRSLVGFDPAEAAEMEACLASATASWVVAGYFVATTCTPLTNAIAGAVECYENRV